MARTVKKPMERRKEIIDAAREMLKATDFETATMNLLMKKLNIAKGTIYHYFTSKEELLEAVVEDMIDTELEKKRAMVESDGFRSMGPLEKFKTFVLSSNIATDNERILKELHNPANTLVHTQQLGRFIAKLAPFYAAIIEEGCAAGVFKVEHPLETAEFLLAGVQFITDVGFYPWSDDDLARRGRALPSLIEAQLGAEPGSMKFLAGA